MGARDSSRVWTGPLHVTICRQSSDDAYMLRKRGPRHQPAERRQVIFSERHSHPPTGRRKRKLSLTQRVNRRRLPRRRRKSVTQQLQ
jgi:hypothetical protein